MEKISREKALEIMKRNAGRRNKVNALKEIAYNAGRNISFDPEKYGEGLLDQLETGLCSFLDQLPEEVRDEYEEKYIDKYKEWLYAMSRTFSQMITGAGGWNARVMRRWEKANSAERAACQRLIDWSQKVIKRCNRKERLTGWAEVERLQAILEDLQHKQEVMRETNKIIRSAKMADIEKLDAIVALGFSEEKALILMDDEDDRKWWGAGFAPFELSNNNAKIKDVEKKIKRHERLASKEDEEKEYVWGVTRIAYSEERYRFIFDGKPAKEVIQLLKSNGFKWSPSNSAWQRQITTNAKYAFEKVIEKLQEMQEKAI